MDCAQIFLTKKCICIFVVCLMLTLSYQINPTYATGDYNNHSAKIADFQKRLDMLIALEDIHTLLEERTDPFNPFFVSTFMQDYEAPQETLKQTFQPPAQCTTSLECMDIGQLTLVAIIMPKQGMPVAMAQDASGLGYILKPGMKIGYRNGVIEKIKIDRVVVSEEYENFNGEIASRDRILFLHPEDE